MARQKPLPIASVTVTDPFWSQWQAMLVESGLLHQHEQLLTTDRLENFARVARGETGTHKGIYFNDSDVYKWIEACAYALAVRPNDPKSNEVRAKMDAAITLVAGAQGEDGYLSTFFQLQHGPEMRWRNLHSMHEMYCGGHLLEAAVAVFECLGDRALLDVAIRFADHVASVFGPDKRKGYCGHEEFEFGLIRLAEATGEPKYRDLAKWMVETRGSRPSPFEEECADPVSLGLSPWSGNLWVKNGVYDGEYGQDHAPVREHQAVVGHAVRAMYLYMAAADTCEDEPMREALARTWSSLVDRRLYITGGLGPSAHNEGFTTDYDLPNLTAYAETCAAVGLVFWARRLYELSGESEYIDVLERALYNGALSGISLDGRGYFYANPLESRGGHQRVPWFHCACCPPNIARLLGSVSRYALGASANSFTVLMPIGFDTTLTLGGVKTRIRLEGSYPWSGKFTLRVDPERPARFAVRLRLPDWAEEMGIELVGSDDEADYEAGFAVFDREWKAGDRIDAEFEMPARWIEANPAVLDNIGRVALTRGPLVYAFESHDGGTPQHFSADLEAEIGEGKGPKTLGQTVALTVEGYRDVSPDFPGLYAEIGQTGSDDAKATAIPYFAWANRGPSHMQVWIRRA